MKYDQERATEKEKELFSTLSETLAIKGFNENDSRSIASVIFSKSIKISPPEQQEFRLECLTINSLRAGGGRSVKAGNILLNIQSLSDAVANGAFAAIGTYQAPWVAPFALIILWNALRRAASIDLSDKEAATIYAMWTHRDRVANEIEKKDLLPKINLLLEKYNQPQMDPQDLTEAIENLKTIGCIAQSKRNTGNYWLREWIRTSF